MYPTPRAVFTYREATPEEILADKRWFIERNKRVRFRHFVREEFAPRAQNGVRHREHSSSAIRVIDGVPHVKHHGKLQPITATVMVGEKNYVFDLRIKSEYLKPF